MAMGKNDPANWETTECPQYRVLHGRDVPAKEYEVLRELTAALVRHTSMSKDRAERQCLLIAEETLRRVRGLR